MITVDFSKRENKSLCETIINSLKNKILNGELKANEKLPSKRSFAEHLGVSVITVQNAYAELISEGYIYSLEKKGFYVTDLLLEKNINTNFLSEKKSSEKSTQNKKQSQKILADFENNSTNVQKFPFSLWAKTMRSVLNQNTQKLLARIESKGILELRNAIKKYLNEFRNMQVNEEQIIIGAGTEILYSMIVQLLGSENIYAVENPGYHKVANLIKLNGAKCIPIKIDDQGIKVEDLEKFKVNVAQVSPSHHFPTGIVMPVRRRLELLNWAKKSANRFIIEDDYDSEFRFNGKPLLPLQSSDDSQKVIFINTFSKTLSPSFRISYMILPKTLLKKYDEIFGDYSCSVSAFEQYTLAKFILDDNFSKHIIKMKNYYRSLRNQLVYEFQKSKLSSVAEIREQNSGLHFLLKIKTDSSGEKLKNLLEENGIKINLLSDFYYSDPPKENTFIINYSGIEKEKIPLIVSTIEKCVFAEFAELR